MARRLGDRPRPNLVIVLDLCHMHPYNTDYRNELEPRFAWFHQTTYDIVNIAKYYYQSDDGA
jgi:hypothetical protein